jgi:hypothetical protein
MIMRFEIGIERHATSKSPRINPISGRHYRADAARLDAAVRHEPIVDHSDCVTRGMSISSSDTLIPFAKAAAPANTSDTSG